LRGKVNTFFEIKGVFSRFLGYLCIYFLRYKRNPLKMITQEQLKETLERKLALRRYL
jgi:hypothetical protein